jgi:hypothetical protein
MQLQGWFVRYTGSDDALVETRRGQLFRVAVSDLTTTEQVDYA